MGGFPASHGAGGPQAPRDAPWAPLHHPSVLTPLWKPHVWGWPRNTYRAERPSITPEEKAPRGCGHAALVTFPPPPIRPLALALPATVSEDFPVFLITPLSAPVFQAARGFFQCPDSPDLLAKLSSAGIFFFVSQF